MTARDYRDSVIQELASSEAALQAQVWKLAERAVTAEADREAYRLLAVQWSHYSHRDRVERERLQAQVGRLRDENRELRAHLMSEGNRAA